MTGRAPEPAGAWLARYNHGCLRLLALTGLDGPAVGPTPGRAILYQLARGQGKPRGSGAPGLLPGPMRWWIAGNPLYVRRGRAGSFRQSDSSGFSDPIFMQETYGLVCHPTQSQWAYLSRSITRASPVTIPPVLKCTHGSAGLMSLPIEMFPRQLSRTPPRFKERLKVQRGRFSSTEYARLLPGGFVGPGPGHRVYTAEATA